MVSARTLRVVSRPVWLVVFLFLGGCAVQLAPTFDRTIVDGLAAANEDALILFASVSDGASRQTFAGRKDHYDRVIGTFDALVIQARARPFPQSGLARSLRVNPRLAADLSEIPRIEEAPSIGAMEKIVEIMKRMRATDGRRGLTAFVVDGFKNPYLTAIDQALIYEKALQR